MRLTSWRNSAVVPTSASESPHAVDDAVLGVVGGELGVGRLHHDLAAREATVVVHVLGPRLHARPTSPGTSPGLIGEPTSAIVVTVIVVVGHADLGRGERRTGAYMGGCACHWLSAGSW